MPRRNRNGRSGRRRGRGSRMTLQVDVNRVVSADFRCIPFRVEQKSSGTGALTSLDSLGSNSSANTQLLDPYQIGGRFADFAEQFCKYRIKRIKITYVPTFVSSSGVLTVPAGTTTTPAYASRPFAWAIAGDAAVTITSFAGCVEVGGQVGNTSRGCSLVFEFRDRKWYHTSGTAAVPTAIDARQIAPGTINWYFEDTSTTNTISYGVLLYEFTAQFQCPAIGFNQIGLSADEEKDPPVVVSPTPSVLSVASKSKGRLPR